jgi:hypothetical protein
MISQSWKRSSVVLGAVVAVSTLGYADAPAAKWFDAIALSGYAQTSYVGNLNSPHTAGTGAKATNTGRQFDLDSNGFAFNTFLLQVAKPVGDSDHYGFIVRLRTGQDATNFPSGGNLVVQEGYLTYAATSRLSLIGGKFVTSEGFEVVDTVSNPNFSEGLLFTYMEPITQTGVKANYVFTDKVNATVGVVNGWDVAPDNNDGKTLLWQVVATPVKQVTWSFQGLYGKEVADPSHAQRLSFDTVLGVNPTDKLSLALQGNWLQETNTALASTGRGTGHAIGLGLWATMAVTAKDSFSARFEVVNDESNLGRFTTSAISRARDSNQTVKEFTLTHKHMLTGTMGVRGEYRHDWSNEAYFTRRDGSAVRNQNTLSADWFLTF